MFRTSSLVAALISCLGTASWAQPTTPLVVSGDSIIAILDTDRDGMPEIEDDCTFKAFHDGNTLLIDSEMGDGIPVEGCLGDYMGTTSANGGIGINFTSAPGFPGSIQLPTMATFFPPGGGGSGAGNGGVKTVNQVAIQLEAGTSEEETAGGVLCSNGGPAVIVRTTDGTTVQVALSFFPDASSPEYLKAPNIPLSDSVGQKVLVDGYIPVTPDGKIEVMSEGAEDPIVEIALNELAACGGPAVPTMNELGLITLMLALLAGGVWILRRRPSFVQSLSVI